MFLLEGYMTYCLLAIKNLISIVDLWIFDIQYGGVSTFIFSRIDTEKFCLILLTVQLMKILLLKSLIDLHILPAENPPRTSHYVSLLPFFSPLVFCFEFRISENELYLCL